MEETGVMKKEILNVNGLCKTFTLSRRQQKIERTHEKKIRAVDHLSFTAYEGEIFGLLGPNGAGKTTTLRILATLIRPDEGDALVDGTSVVRQFERFGISQFAEVKVANLSTGMKQKVSIVISILHDPNIIIFDEPTNGLDVLTARTVTDFLLELRRRGKTVILSTHIFSLVEKLCDRVGIIVNGRMAVCDTLSALTASEDLEEVFFDIYQKAAGDDRG